MYFVIETEEQLSKLTPTDSCFLQVIPNNYSYHPKLAKVSLYYYKSNDKGYIISIEHSESMSLNNELVLNLINKHNSVYVVDKKYHSHFVNHRNLIDLQFLNNGVQEQKTRVQLEYESNYRNFSGLNNIIPIVKHYEHLESLHKAYENYLDRSYSKTLDTVIDAYSYVESNPIKVNLKRFEQVYKLTENNASLKGDLIYNQYNLHNPTGRPTNAFNGVNFLAIPKDKEHRECFVPNNDYFVEFDFDAYHLRLIARETGYKFSKESVHEQLGKEYFGKQELSEDEYKQSKTISFRNMYGNAPEEHQHIPFVKSMVTLSKKLSDGCAPGESMQLPTGVTLVRDRDMYDNKLMNYYVQNLETYENAKKINKLKAVLEGKKTKLVLITYDSFLFDYSLDDGKNMLLNIKSILEEGEMVVKHKHGKTYFL